MCGCMVFFQEWENNSGVTLLSGRKQEGGDITVSLPYTCCPSQGPSSESYPGL